MPDKTEVKSSWADEVEHGEGEEKLPAPVEKFDSNKGTKTTTEYIRNEDGKKVKVVRQYKLEKRTVSKSIAKRKTWAKFGQSKTDKPGPNPATTIVAEEIFIQFITSQEEENKDNDDPLNKLKGKGGVKCRLCKEDHWTTQCPYKDHLGPLVEGLPKGDEVKPVADVAAPESSNTGTSGKYVPPSKREGANRKGESMMPSRTRDETATVRVSNLSESTRDSDLQDLFRPFGNISRVFLAKDKVTGQSKGFAYINYHKREDAKSAIDALNGFGYDHLILSVEWAKPSTNN